MSLTDNRNTPARIGETPYNGPVAAGEKLFTGALAVLDAGYLAAGSTATGLVAIGRSNKLVDNSGGQDGDLKADVETGRAFQWKNGDSIAQADVGKTAYVSDDETVTKAGTGKSPAGIIVGVDSDGVWVFMSEQLSRSLLQSMAAQATADAALPFASIQYVTGKSLVSGDVAVTTGVVITASSLVIPIREIDDATHAGALTITGQTVGGAGVGAFTIHSADAADSSKVGALILG